MSAGALSLGRGLLQWLRDDPQWSRLPWSLRAQLTWKAQLGSLNSRFSQAQVADAPALRAPLLIVGPWRSGTTVMHELLSAATGLPTPLTWQCMNATAFQLLGRPAKAAAVARPMDGLEIGALSPQEDEFALLSLGADSAYRGFLMPHRLGELEHTLSQDYWVESSQWLPAWEAFLQGVLSSLGRAGERLILKSPNHTFRLQAVLRRFPDAKLVWMSRDPIATFLSNRKMWSQMFATHALTSPDDCQALDRFLTRALTASADALRALCIQCAPTQLQVCDMDQLQQEPAANVARVLDALALGNPDTPALETALQRTTRGRIERYTPVELPREVLAAAAELAQAQRFAIDSHGVSRGP